MHVECVNCDFVLHNTCIIDNMTKLELIACLNAGMKVHPYVKCLKGVI